eukprot:gene24174-32599_t
MHSNAENLEVTSDCVFDKVHRDPHDFQKSGFALSLSPLVKQAAEGASVMSIICSTSSPSRSQDNPLTVQILPSAVMLALLSQAASQLVHLVHSDSENAVETVGRTTVTFSWFNIDCTGSSETITDVLKSASAAGSSGHGAVSSNSNSSLLLRELGKGRGMMVPGLWEVEINSGSDIEAVVNHINSSSYEFQINSHSHTVMQLTVTNKSVAESNKATHSGSVLGDPPGLGRLTFLLFSNQYPDSDNNNGKKIPLSPSTPYAWVSLLSNILQWLESRRPSPPFHKSRLLLLIRDVLYARQQASFLLLLSPSEQKRDENWKWLDIFSRIAALGRSHSEQLSSTSADHSFVTNQHSSDFDNKSEGSVTRRLSTNVNTPIRRKSISAQSLQHSFALAAAPPTQSKTSEDLIKRRASMAATPAATSRATRKSVTLSNIFNQPQFSLTAEPPPPPQSNGYVEDFTRSENEAALAMALEASRSEASALKVALLHSNEKYEETKKAYDSLLDQLKEEGAMLNKRDKERFRSALKDLKDYEIYKEVMETAMIKLQSELEAHVNENSNLKNHRHQEERQAVRHRNFTEKYTKDLCATKKKLADVEAKLQASEKQAKQLGRERDVAVTTLAQMKSVGSHKEGLLQTTSEMRQSESDNLRRRVLVLEEKCKALELEKESILASNIQEVATLRSAHSKALEMIMTYQEEGDSLRTQLSALQGEKEKEKDKDKPKRTDTPAKSVRSSIYGKR